MSDSIDIKKSKILIVDDLPENIKLLGAFLKKDFKIAVASNGKQAVETSKKFKPDLTLMDINMPVMDGFEATEKIIADSNIPDHPIIFTTALNDVKDVIKGFEFGAVDYVTKPFELKILEKRIRLHLKLQRSQKIIEDKNSELRELVKMKDKFFSIVSHDLRGPFGGLLNMTEMMIENFDFFDHKEIKENLTGMFKSVDQLHSFVEKLLDWARMQTNRMNFTPIKMNLTKILNGIILLFENNLKAKNIELKFQCPENVTVYTDENMINTIIRNLLSNAIKFTHHNGNISIIVDETTDKYSISISDTGIGISKENIDKLFNIDQHHLQRGTNNEKGTGLGLLITKEMVEKQGGNIEVSSEVAKGSVFTFTVPKYSEKLTGN